MNQITVEELHERLNNNPDLHILDVREEDEYNECNIGARLWSLSKLKQMDADGLDDWKGKEIIVHCRSGQRSLQACMLLETMGFTQLTNLKGGIKEWLEKFGTERLA